MIPFLDASSTFSELPHILSSIQTSKGSEGSQNNGVCYFVMKMITQLTCGVRRDYPPDCSIANETLQRLKGNFARISIIQPQQESHSPQCAQTLT